MCLGGGGLSGVVVAVSFFGGERRGAFGVRCSTVGGGGGLSRVVVAVSVSALCVPIFGPVGQFA